MPSDLRVRGNRLVFQGKEYACAIGKAGVSANKREGDNCTPLGRFVLRECWWRPDRLPAPPVTVLPLKAITPQDGWCDDPADAMYNRHVPLPYPARHETLWREDAVYDVVVPLGYNDNPITPSKGSAIFLHVAREGYAGTEGCVALALADVLEVLRGVERGSGVVVEA